MRSNYQSTVCWYASLSVCYQVNVVYIRLMSKVANWSSTDGTGSVMVVEDFTHDVLQKNVEQHGHWGGGGGRP